MALADLAAGAMMNVSISTHHSIEAYSDRRILDQQDIAYFNKQFKYQIKECTTAHMRTRKYRSESHS